MVLAAKQNLLKELVSGDIISFTNVYQISTSVLVTMDKSTIKTTNP